MNKEPLPLLEELDAPQAWVFGLFSIDNYFRKLGGDRFGNQMRVTSTQNLVKFFLYEKRIK